jgi:hypothetical protein
VSHGRFHDILPEEYSGTFPALHGDNKKRCLLTTGLNQIFSLTRLIPEIKYIPCQKDFSLRKHTFVGEDVKVLRL